MIPSIPITSAGRNFTKLSGKNLGAYNGDGIYPALDEGHVECHRCISYRDIPTAENTKVMKLMNKYIEKRLYKNMLKSFSYSVLIHRLFHISQTNSTIVATNKIR